MKDLKNLYPEKEYDVLNNGVKIPVIGYGTWLINNEIADKCVYEALEMGYRHIDSAQIYGNEVGVGKGMKMSSVKREDIFLTTKVDAKIKSYEKAKESIEKSLKKLDVDYIDLMIIHCPMPWNEYKLHGGYRYEKENLEVWRALEEAYEAGKLRAIGVSNFSEEDLDNILKNCKIPPMINQIQICPGWTPIDNIEYCHKNNVVVEAYSPIAHGDALKNKTLIALADKYHVSVAQLCIRYTLQLDTVTLPKSTNPEHMKSNLKLDFIINEEDMELMKAIHIPQYFE